MDFGTVLGDRYRLDRPIGAGGMGQVWQARDLKLERDLGLARDVAIKLMHQNLASDEMLKRFQREVLIAGSLNHPQVTVVHDAGWHEGQLFFVMELLKGRDLGKILAGHAGGLPVGRTVDLARQLATGLAAVHSCGIVHRDLKPVNLFIQAGDLLKICDFGIARDNSMMSTITPHGAVIGTPPYIAPERWLGTESAEPSSDLYAMGCILYQLLTGSVPFRTASTTELIRMHREEPPAPPRTRNGAIPEQLNALVLQLLAKQPGRRPASAEEVAGRLAEIKDALTRAAGGAKADGARAGSARPEAGPASQGAGGARASAGNRGAGGPRASAANGGAGGARAAGARANETARVTAPVACLSLSEDHRQVFVLAAAGKLKTCSYWPRPGWSAWRDLPLPPNAGCTVVTAQAYASHQKLAVAAGGNVYHRWRIGEPGAWSNWRAMPALDVPVADLALAPVAAGHWEVIALDTAGALHLRTGRGDDDPAAKWTTWSDFAGPGAAPVTAIAASCASSRYQDVITSHRQDLIAVADGVLWHKRRGGEPKSMPAWSAWRALPSVGGRVVDVACSSLGTWHAEVLAVDDTGTVRSREYLDKAGWSAWRDMPGPPGEKVAAIASTSYPFSAHQKLAAVTRSGKVYHAWSGFGPGGGSRWSPWRDMRGPQ